jgi:4-hydroxybenzoate polyprenyltransferase
MMPFLKLIRIINLLIIVLTMYGVHTFLIAVNYDEMVNTHLVDFFLLVLSTVMIAAGGNIINDYFDVKADRVNKPEKLIITKHIKRRWAIVTHWALNGIAFSIAIYLSTKYQTLWFVFIHLISINTLWFYSMLFKRKVLVGNLMIASMTALVPILVVIFFRVNNYSPYPHSEFDPLSWNADIDYSIIYLIAAFAFIQNLAREIIKDAQDVEGDRLIYVKSLPMVIGEKKSLRIVVGLLLALPVFYGWISIGQLETIIKDSSFLTATLPFALAALINLSVILFILVQKKMRLKLYDALIKISMLIGVLATFYIAYLYQ